MLEELLSMLGELLHYLEGYYIIWMTVHYAWRTVILSG